LVEGEYVRCPEGTPAYPGIHHYGSRNWDTNYKTSSPPLGEDLAAKQRWTPGEGPDPFPLPRIVGPVGEVENGLCRPPDIRWEIESDGHRALEVDGTVIRYELAAGVDCGGNNPEPVGISTVRYYFTLTQAQEITLHFEGTLATTSGASPAATAVLPGLGSIGIATPGGGFGCNTAFQEDTLTGIVQPGNHVCTVLLTDGVVGFSAAGEINFSISRDPPFYLNETPQYENYPLECYFPPEAPIEVPAFWPNVQRRDHARDFAEVIELLYVNAAAAETRLAAFLGAGWTYRTSPVGTAFATGNIIAKSNQGTIVVSTGTTNFNQLALQVLYAGPGPVPQGPFSAHEVFFEFGSLIHAQMLAFGVDASKKVMLVGHSLGGSALCCLAGLYVNAQPERQVEVLTYGAPRAGDFRLRNLLLPLRMVTYANLGDPAPGVPPRGEELAAVLYLLTGPVLNQWLGFIDLPNQRRLYEDGRMEDSQETTCGITTLLGLTVDAIAGDPFPVFSRHFIAEYRRRLSLPE